jgi:hypothetical protein
MNKILPFLGVLLVYIIGQIFTFYQLQGHMLYKWVKDNPLIMSIMGVPITYLVIKASRVMLELWDGQGWPNRLIGYGVGVIVFTIMSWFLLKEPMTLKTGVCLGLSILIILVQFFWK